jgi:hypothetical protein
MRRHLLFACAAALAAAPVANARPFEVGAQDDGVFLGHYGDRTKAFTLAGRLRASRIRVMVQWSKVLGPQATLRRTPRVPRWNFGELDSLLGAADANRVKVQMVLTGPAPAFATANHAVGPYKPNARQFARFVAAVVRHFKGRVDRYSIWNEPNHKGWLAPVAAAPRLYRALYASGYRTVKRIDPGAQVLIGETVPYDIHDGRTAMAPLRFLRQMLCVDARYRHSRCGHVNADGYAHHPYDFTHAPTYRYPGAENVTIATLGRLTSALDKLRRIGALRGPGGGKLPVYLTEYGYFVAGTRRIPESRRARYLVGAFKIAIANPRVREMVQYLLIEPPRGSAGEFFSTWLANRAGTPLPAFRALAAYLKKALPTSPAASPRPAARSSERHTPAARSPPARP